MKKDKKINIEFTKDEISVLSEICLEELFNICKLQYQRFVDRVAVQKRIEEVKQIMDKLTESEA